MKKVILLPDILIAAIQANDPVCLELIDYCKTSPDVRCWIMANTVSVLVAKELDKEAIASVIDGLAQVPVNALFNERALGSIEEFQLALHVEAAKVYKLGYVITREKTASQQVISPERFLNMKASDRVEKVDFLDLNLLLHPIFNQVDGWYTEIIQNTAFAGGNHVQAFEEEFARYCGAEHAIGVSSGTDALLFALIAMGIGKGDEVITVPNTFIATTEAISQAGATPVFVDILPDSYNMDPGLIEPKITERTKAILPVHLYGQIADMEPILSIAEKHDLVVLEDACQAHGAVYQGKRAGTIGRAGAFSMYPGKNLGAFGEAGCVVTNDASVAEMIKCLRDHGQNKKYYHQTEGYNGRMDNLQAAAIRAKLPLLDDWNSQRGAVARQYLEVLDSVDQVTLPKVPEFEAHVFHLFVILVPDPNELSAYLNSKNIFTGFHYPLPLHLQEAYQNNVDPSDAFPVTERCAEQLISLPMYPGLSEKQVMYVCDEIKRYYQTSDHA